MATFSNYKCNLKHGSNYFKKLSITKKRKQELFTFLKISNYEQKQIYQKQKYSWIADDSSVVVSLLLLEYNLWSFAEKKKIILIKY